MAKAVCRVQSENERLEQSEIGCNIATSQPMSCCRLLGVQHDIPPTTGTRVRLRKHFALKSIIFVELRS